MSEDVKLNIAGFRALRTSAAAQRIIDKTAEKIAKSSGDGYIAVSTPGKRRSRAIIRPDTVEAMHDNQKNLTIIRNLDAGR